MYILGHIEPSCPTSHPARAAHIAALGAQELTLITCDDICAQHPTWKSEADFELAVVGELLSRRGNPL